MDAGDRVTSTYSGGMRRRLDLAAALVAKPPVLFLDEPTTGLDPRSRIGMWETIEGLVAEGTTVLLTTQYLDEADRLADSIAVIDHGQVIAQGTSDELKDRVGGERVEVVLEDAADAPKAIRALAPMAEGEPTSRDTTVSVAVRARRGVLVEAVKLLSDAGVGIEDVNVRRPTLDDVFLSLTGHAAEEAAEARKRRRKSSMRRLVTDTLIIAERNLVRLPRARTCCSPSPCSRSCSCFCFATCSAGRSTPAGSLRGLPDPRDHRAEHRLRRLRDRAGPQRGRPQGPDRSLPLAADGPPAVLAGRTLADVVTNPLSVVMLVVTGVIIGFSFQTGART